MSRVNQEFHCNDCDGYIMVPLHMELNNYKIVVVCPNCGREHPRTINKGKIVDDYHGGRNCDKIRPTKAAYSKEARHKTSKKNMRNGNVIADEMINQSWLERFGNLVR